VIAPAALRSRRALLVVGLVAVVLVATLALRPRGASSAGAGSPLIGKPAPALAGTTLSGQRFALRPGHVTVVNIWASWCDPCRQEVPLVADLARRWAGDGIQVATIDTRDGVSPARDFLAKVGASGLLAVQDPNGRIAVGWGATGVPETFVVDARGVVRARWIGAVSEDWLTGQVERWSTA
jgi:cytochrome c biogenesis protein CcmG, thiol:disulfide interchange protein DsbE